MVSVVRSICRRGRKQYSPGNHSTMSVRFEPVDDNFFDVHGAGVYIYLLLFIAAC